MTNERELALDDLAAMVAAGFKYLLTDVVRRDEFVDLKHAD